MLVLEELEKGAWKPLYILSYSCLWIYNYLITKSAIINIVRQAYSMKYYGDSLIGPNDFQLPSISHTNIVWFICISMVLTSW